MQPIPLPQLPKVTKSGDNAKLFEIEGCYPGYGTTLGNALRRVLLSSLEGAAITNFKIKGVNHEFSTIPNIVEDVIQIILNLKKIRLISHKDQPVKAKISVKGEKTVTAKDIKVPSSVEIVSKDSVIATLTDKKAKLEMEVTIEKGIGYVMAEEREEKEREIGVIEIDSLFSPVTKVNLEIENMRVGKRTDFERLKLTIETDGTVNPEEAFDQSAAILLEQFSQFTTKKIEQPKKAVKKVEKKKKKAEEKEKEISDEDALELPIQNLKLPARTSNLLNDQNFKQIGDLATMTEEEVLKIEGMGEKGLRDIKKSLGNFGIVLENEEEIELKKLQKK